MLTGANTSQPRPKGIDAKIANTNRRGRRRGTVAGWRGTRRSSPSSRRRARRCGRRPAPARTRTPSATERRAAWRRVPRRRCPCRRRPASRLPPAPGRSSAARRCRCPDGAEHQRDEDERDDDRPGEIEQADDDERSEALREAREEMPIVSSPPRSSARLPDEHAAGEHRREHRTGDRTQHWRSDNAAISTTKTTAMAMKTHGDARTTAKLRPTRRRPGRIDGPAPGRGLPPPVPVAAATIGEGRMGGVGSTMRERSDPSTANANVAHAAPANARSSPSQGPRQPTHRQAPLLRVEVALTAKLHWG